MRATVLLLGLMACSCSDPQPTVVVDPAEPLPADEDGRILLPSAKAPTGVYTRFAGRSPFSPTGEQAFALKKLCPELTWVSLVQDSERFHVLTVQGERLDNIVGISVLKPDDTLASAKHQALPGADLGAALQGAIEVPLACDDCIVFFGVELPDGAWAACRGPGYAVELVDGKVVAGTGT